MVDADGIIRYRRTADQGDPTWRPDEVGAVVDDLLEGMLSGTGEVPSPEAFRLEAAYPNPFNPSTNIPYRLGGEGADVAVTLRILDVRGRAVRTLVDERQAAGRDYEITWDGRDDAGRGLPSGAYLASLEVQGRTQARFLTLVK